MKLIDQTAQKIYLLYQKLPMLKQWLSAIVCGCSLLCVLHPGFAFSSKSCMGKTFGNEIDENSVIMILNLFIQK